MIFVFVHFSVALTGIVRFCLSLIVKQMGVPDQEIDGMGFTNLLTATSQGPAGLVAKTT